MLCMVEQNQFNVRYLYITIDTVRYMAIRDGVLKMEGVAKSGVVRAYDL
jgi:hypothetical protein